MGAFRENVIRVIGSYSTKNVPAEKLEGEMLDLIEENTKKGSPLYVGRYKCGKRLKQLETMLH